MIEVNRQGEVWVFAEQHHGVIQDTSVELMSKAKHLSEVLNVPLASVLLGDDVKESAEKVIHYGADKVYLASHPLLADYQTNSYAKVIYDLVHKYKPQIVLYGATVTGRDLAPRVAAAIDAGLATDCTEAWIEDEKLRAKRPVYAGKSLITVDFIGTPAMASLRPNVFTLGEVDESRTAEVEELEVTIEEEDLKARVKEFIASGRLRVTMAIWSFFS